jgi:hypothetical protein
VFIPRMKNGPGLQRFFGAGILLFVFFLPLHLHFPADAQVGEECVCCYYGGRVQMSLASAAPILGPFAWVLFLTVRQTEVPFQVAIKSELARAPPYFLAS